MKPYYDEDGITIYHGDCREILPTLAYDSLVTDPPYGIDFEHAARHGAPVHGDDEPYDPSVLDLSRPSVIWGGNNFCDRLPIGGWLVWLKHTDERFHGNWNKSDCELAWTNTTRKVLAIVHLWSGAIRQDPEENGRKLPHPTQKPVSVMRWCLGMTAGTIMDPYTGSGSTLVAAKLEGRKAIGIELDERYCEIAVRRLAQKVFDFA